MTIAPVSRLGRTHGLTRGRRRVVSILGVLALASLTSACDLALSSGKEQASETWSKKYPLGATGKLTISNTNGRISVAAGGGDEVSVEATKKARGVTKEAAEETLKKIDIREDVSAGEVKLETKVVGAKTGNTSVDYVVHVPAGAAVNLSNVNGQIDITATTGAVHASVTNGTVEGHDLGGAVNASTTNGKIEVELKELTGDIKLGTTNGPVSLTLPSSSKADLSLEVTNGGIDVEGFTLDGDKERRRVRGRINGGGARIDAETVNGPIRIAGR
jgi:DUF4097 and DUF4098 domain-containing protein YvlB